MKYTVTITIRDQENGGAEKSFERTVSFERERSSVHPHNFMPIDVDQKRRVLELALNEAARDALKEYPVARVTDVGDPDARFRYANRMGI